MTFTFDDLSLEGKDVLRQRLLALFERDISTVQSVFSSRSYTFTFDEGDFPTVLRVSEETPHHTAQDTLSMLMWVDDLKIDVPNVCQAIPSQENRLVERVTTDEKTYLAVLLRKADGARVPISQWDKSHFYNSGALLGKIHRSSSEGYQRGFRYKRMHWDEKDAFDFSRLNEYFDPSARRDAEAVLQRIKSIPRDPRWYSMTHGDFYNTNLFSDCGTLWTFGFDNCCYGYFMFDIATLAHIFMEGKVYSETSSPITEHEHLLGADGVFAQIRAGYSSEYTLPDEHWDLFPDFFRLRIAECLSVATVYEMYPRDITIAVHEPLCAFLKEDRNPIERIEEVCKKTVLALSPEQLDAVLKGVLTEVD